MDQQSSQNTTVEEISFAELTAMVKAELQANPDSECTSISEKYGISEVTMEKLIKQIKSDQSSNVHHS